jgi:hypothetical protein
VVIDGRLLLTITTTTTVVVVCVVCGSTKDKPGSSDINEFTIKKR